MFEKAPEIESKEKPIIEQEAPSSVEKDAGSWGRVKNFINVAVAAIALSLATPGTGEAAPGAKDVQTLKNTIEAAKVVTYKIEKELIELVSAKGNPGTVGEQPVKILQSNDSWTVEVGYNKDMSKAEWTIIASPDGSISLIDNNNDGLIDRYVLNDEAKNPRAKSAENMIYLFEDTKSLDKTFPTEVKLASSTPGGKNKVDIGIFTNKDNNISFHSYNKQSGEVINNSSPLASKFQYDMESRFYDALKGSVERYK